jgi:DNA-binding response OmpR family regulator
VPAVSGEKALELLSADVDLVLADVMLPGMSGFDLVRRMRATRDFTEIPVIMITALSDEADRRMAWECGASDFIAKPVDRTELSLRMASLLRLKEAFDRQVLSGEPGGRGPGTHGGVARAWTACASSGMRARGPAGVGICACPPRRNSRTADRRTPSASANTRPFWPR